MKITKIKRKFGAENVTLEVVNTYKEFKWRLRINKQEPSVWTTRYTGILTVKSTSTGNVFAVVADTGRSYGFFRCACCAVADATDKEIPYWVEVLPCIEPFQIKLGRIK